MTDRHERLNQQIDAMLADRAPTPFVAEDEEERAVLEMAARLRLLRPGAALPRRRYLSAFYRRLSRLINPRPGLARRSILLGGAGGLVAGIVAGVGVTLGLRSPENRPFANLAGRAPAPQPAGWAAVAKRQDVPDGGAVLFSTPAFSGYVLRTGDTFSALSAICPHRGCWVDWKTDGKEFVCRCDGAEFDRSGTFYQDSADPSAYTASAPPPPLTRLAVRLDGDVVHVKRV